MIVYDGKEYQDNESIDWDTAVRVGGAYFHQARQLGLPMPPACFVFIDNYAWNSAQSLIVGWYSALLHASYLDCMFKKDARRGRVEQLGI